MKNLNLLVLALILTAQSAFAAKEAGNGGDAVRVDIISIRSFISKNCDGWQSLRDGHVDVEALRAKIDEVGTSTLLLKVEDNVTLGDGVPRSAVNHPEIPSITFSRNFWLAAKDDTARKVGIVLHEYLGLMGIEKTDVSPISSEVVNELHMTALIAKPMPNFLKEITQAYQDVSKAKSCRVNLPMEERSRLLNAAMETFRGIYARKDAGPDEKALANERYEQAYDLLLDLNVAWNEGKKFCRN